MVMATCGYMIDDKSMAKLKEAGVEALSFSLDGATASTHDDFRGIDGAFDSVMAATAIAKKHHVRFQINTTISRINIDEVGEIMDLAGKLGAECFDAFILVPTGRGEQMAGEVLDPVQYEVLLNELFEAQNGIEDTCSCYLRAAVFENLPTGRSKRSDSERPRLPRRQGIRVYKLPRRRADLRLSGRYPRATSSAIIIISPKSGSVPVSFAKFAIRRNTRTSAANCEFVGVCGGCRARAYAMTGDYLGKDPICDYKPGEKK